MEMWELANGEKVENLYTNVWVLVSRCKTRAGFQRLWKHATMRHTQIKRRLDQSKISDTLLSEFGASMMALGIVRGMQLGRELERESKRSGTSGLLLKHASVRRLLLRRATTKEICSALDEKDVPLPGKLRGTGTWERLMKEPLVKVAVADARKAATQEAMFSEFMAISKGVGDDGSILKTFQPKKFGWPK